MASKYFTVEVSPTVAASKQHAGAMTSGVLIADWTAFQVPRGSNMLRSATLLIRPKGDAGPTVNNHPFGIAFSKTNTVSLGTVGSSIQNRPSNDFLGVIEFDATNFSTGTLQSTAVATVGGDSSNACPPLILEGDITTGDNVGFDTIYVAIFSQSADNTFQSINTIAEASFNEGTQTVITFDDGSDGGTTDIREHFAVGDVLHAQDDAVLGTVASVDSATQLTLTATNTDDIAENDIIYNINPIKLVLGFER
tara:strand:+ start:52 stop:807 length:756 start_codon:yes stop_codon:yes gene_type:complete